MTNRKLFPGLCILLLWLASLACNLPLTGSGSTTLILPTLTPFPTPEFIQTDFVPDPVFFVEEFDQGVPEDWKSTPGWTVENGILSANRTDAKLEIPGEWQEKRLILRLQVRSGAGILDFNVSPSGFYRLIFSQDEISLEWQPADGEPESLSSSPLELNSDWYVLVLEQARGLIGVELDGETLFSGLHPGYSPSGSLRLINSGNSWLEIDRFVVGPPGE